MFQMWERAAAISINPIKELRMTWRVYIVNDEIRLIIGRAQVIHGPGDLQEPYLEYKTGDSGSFALLGSPNGNGAPFNVDQIIVDQHSDGYAGYAHRYDKIDPVTVDF